MDVKEVERVFADIAYESFPDNSDVKWHIRAVREAGSYCCVEAEAEPATIGYPRFRFVIGRVAAGNLDALGCYVLDGGRWSLLFTSPGGPSDWKKLGFDAV